MTRYLKVILMGKLFFIIGTAALFAAVGSVGSNGEIPYLTLNSKYVDDPITITLHQAAPDHEHILYLFSMQDSFRDWTEFVGPGGYILERENLIIFKTTEEQITIYPSPELGGMNFYIQALVKEKEPNSYGSYFTASRPYAVEACKRFDDLPNREVELVGFVPHAGEIQDMTMVGDTIYCASSQLALVKFLRNPAGNPTWCGALQGGNFTFFAKRICADNKRAVLTADTCILGVADVSDPGKCPQFMGEMMAYGYKFYDGVVHSIGGSTYAFLNAAGDGLVAVDITNSSNFAIAGEYLMGEFIRGVGEWNGYLYVLTHSCKGYVFDLASGLNLNKVAEFSVPTIPGSITFHPGSAMVLSKSGGEVHVYSLPSSFNGSGAPTLIQTLEFDASFDGVSADTTCDYAFVFEGEKVQCMYIESDKTLTLADCVYLDGYATDVVADGGTVHAGRSSTGRGIDTIDLYNMQKVNAPDYNLLHTKVRDLALVKVKQGSAEKRFAYIIEYKIGLRIVDATDVSKPVLMSMLECDPLSVTTYGDKLIYSERPNHIRVCSVNFSDGSLIMEHEFDSALMAKSLCMSGDYLYVADSAEGMRCYNMTDVMNPEFVCQVKDETAIGSVYNVATAGYLVYMSGPKGLNILDVSLRDAPELVQSIPGYGEVGGAMAGDGFSLFVTGLSEGVEVFDTSAPFSPTGCLFNTSFSYLNWPSGAAIFNNVAVASIQFSGNYLSEKYLVLYDITDTGCITTLEKYPYLPGFNGGVETMDGYIFVSDTESLLDIIRLE